MSLIHTWALLLVWVHASTANQNPEDHVTCIVSKDCVLPCAFQPGGVQEIQWFRLEELVYSSEENQTVDDEFAGRASLSPLLGNHGNASLVLSKTRHMDRGKYRCHVRTTSGVHDSHVVVKVEVPIQSLSLERSRLSGYEEIKCMTHDVYPPPHVTWVTIPPISGNFKPITRKFSEKKGMYTVESRLRRVMDQPEIIYICNVTSAYASQSWTASLRDREINAVEGQGLTIPCHSPPYLNGHSLSWNFTNGEDTTQILSYDTQSRKTLTSSQWQGRVKLDASRALTGDGSLRLMDTDREDDSGTYTCVFSAASQMHTEHSDVFFTPSSGDKKEKEKLDQEEEHSYWWIVALVMAVLAVALVGFLVYLKFKGRHSTTRKDPEEPIELHGDPTESIPLAGDEIKESPGKKQAATST